MHAHAMPFGALPLADGGTRFRLWAPACAQVDVEVGNIGGNAASDSGGNPAGNPGTLRRRMQALADGWHERVVKEASHGTRYHFIVPQENGHSLRVPDPASRCNPDGVHAASQVIEPNAFTWSDTDWHGRPWSEAVIYELHVGSFTPAGSFSAVRARLRELVALGITAIELMPLAAFAGRRNWGYDGVLPFAPAACYGTPDELKALVDAAHALDLMVLLDVVYNHFGPEGNYLHTYAPQFFNPAQRTPWGAAINFDGEMNRTVRDFFIHNALYWIEEYHFDGLRLDAVHAIRDDSTTDIVEEISLALRNGPGRGRHVHLLLENDANGASYLARDAASGAPLLATAQWNDDIHHALHVLTSGEQDGYYADYDATSPRSLGRALAEGFVYQGQHSPFRNTVRGEPSAQLPPAAFVAFLQNHDQVGNRAFGDRIHMLADPRLLRAAYACLLLSPQVPMLFMGEEFAASTPFLYFCSFDGDLAQAVVKGRRDEFKRFAAFADESARLRIPDPNALATFAASTLRHEEREISPHREQLELVRNLLAIRRRWLTPRLDGMRQGGRFEVEGMLLRVEWHLGDDSCWRLLAHFGSHDVYCANLPAGHCVYRDGLRDAWPAGMCFAPGAVMVVHGALGATDG